MVQVLHAQQETLVQIKAFDSNMKPMANIGISLNGKDFIMIDKKGVAFQNVLKEDLPPKSIKINNDNLESESWNYSKGTLEIIVRKKMYKVVDIRAKDADNKALANLKLQFNGIKTTTTTTNAQGNFQLPIGLNEELTAEKFLMPGFRVVKILADGAGKVIIIVASTSPKDKESVAKPITTPDIVKNFKISELDSITSLTVFYSVFKKYDISKFDDATRKKIDDKFYQLASQKNKDTEQQFIGKISDSSFVSSDVKNLLAQAARENQLLDKFRMEFNQKIQLINEKLSGGTSNLDAAESQKLFDDINILENVLSENESKFYKNISDYRTILNSLKSSFSNIRTLETKLELVEAERQKEQKAFREKILIAGSVTVVFGVLLVFLFYLRSRLKRQQKNLIDANAQITLMNENLEGLVFERTSLLLNAYREMDIFLYRASHDLRSPISSIVGLCNLAQYSSEAELLQLMKKISGTARQMDTMLDKLKVISEINQPSNYSAIYFSQTLEYLKTKFNKFIIDNKVTLNFDCPADISFSSYPNLLEIILSNLFENALFFSTVNQNANPVVTIKARKNENLLTVSVHDNGVGIDYQLHTKLWEMFFVGHEYSKGNGLGLYIVDKALQALNGKIVVQSEPHKFTLFTASIPVNTNQINTLTSVNPLALKARNNILKLDNV